MKIACVLITHFPVKAELLRHEDLQGKPVIVVDESESKRLVVDSTPAARGVKAGMTLSQALSRSKNTVVLTADQPYYERCFQELMTALLDVSDRVEKGPLGIQTLAFLEIGNVELMHGGEEQTVSAIQQAIPVAYNPRIGISEGKFAANVVALVAEGQQAIKVTFDIADFLRDKPVDMLPLPTDNIEQLHQFGLHQIGELADIELPKLQAQLGSTLGKLAWELSNGIDNTPLIPYRPNESVSAYLTFPNPATTVTELLLGIEMLLKRVFKDTDLKSRHVTTVTIECKVLYKPTWTKRYDLKQPVGDPDRAFFSVKSQSERIELPGPLEDMMLTVSGLVNESGTQVGLFEDIRKRDQLANTIKTLQERLGVEAPLTKVVSVKPCHPIPERRDYQVPLNP